MVSVLSPHLVAELRRASEEDELDGPVYGEAIFSGDDPRSFEDFVGQEEAVEQLQVNIALALADDERLGHALIGSGIAGVGKSTLAKIVAYVMGVGLVQGSGPTTVEKMSRLMLTMKDRDILFWDEVHTLVKGNKNGADWILPFFTDGHFLTPNGIVKVPNVTFMGATTDVGKMPATLVGRFMVTPQIVPYSKEEGALIAAQLARRMNVDAPEEALGPVARAADNNPRVMRKVLVQLKATHRAYPSTHPNLAKAFSFAGVSEDGLTREARAILLLLAMAPGHTLGLATIQSRLNEPGSIAHHEQQLHQRGYIDIGNRGRTLTDAGRRRAREEAATTLAAMS